MVAEGIVDRLEAVEVDEEHRHLPIGAARQFEGVADALLQQVAVGEAGQGVVQGEVAQPVSARRRSLTRFPVRPCVP